MKLKINKACDLSSISVLPPQSRRLSGVSSGLESSSVFGRSQTASQLRLQQSQPTLSQGISSQHGLFSQFSQNSQDDILTNEKIGSQERESSTRRTSSFSLLDSAREENQIIASRTSNNMMRKWSSQEYKCHKEELEHRIGMIETSLNRLGHILDSVQGDIMQANKGTKEVALETKDMRQKLNGYDDLLQLMSKGQLEIKTGLDTGFKYLSDHIKQTMTQETSGLIMSSLSDLSEKIDGQLVKLQNDLRNNFCKEIQEITRSMTIHCKKQVISSISGSKAPSASAVSCNPSPLQLQFPDNYFTATTHLKTQQTTHLPKVELGGWTSVKQDRAAPVVGNHNKTSGLKKTSPHQMGRRIVIESDEEIDVGFSCLFEEKGTDKYSAEDLNKETERILRKARRRKRKHCNTIIIN